MCGIAGYIGKEAIAEERIDAALKRMRNRGPDVQRAQRFTIGDTHILFLHSRLSIIDLDERAHQPFTLDDCTLIFNGEIYNYVELREELKRQGVSFTTTSDTEVLLQSYLLYGEDCVKKFEGMWAFAILDRREKKVFLSRDRFAEKPLYYMETTDGMFFGSEIKFIRTLSGRSLTVNEQHLLRYLVNGYKSLYKTQKTFFKEIKEIPYATSMVVSGDLKIRQYRYWQPEYRPREMTLKEAVDGFRERLLESMRIRLRSDVPLAFCLSGGIDSGTLTSIASKIFKYDVHTFSIIDSDERYNERGNIQATIDDIGCRNTIIEIPKEDFLSRLRKLIDYHDSPVSTITYYVHSFLSEAIAANDCRVAISGTAADELATGYYDHFNLYLYEMRGRSGFQEALQNWERYTKPVVRNPHLQNPMLYFDNPTFRDHIYLNRDVFAGFLKKDFTEQFEEENFDAPLLRNRMLNELFHEATPVILHEDDLNSMFYSIENRSPYLDSRLFEFAYSIPTEYLIQDGYGKFILRESMRGILNETVRGDRQKKGFNASIHSLLDFNDAGNRSYLLSGGPVCDLVDINKIKTSMEMNPMSNSFSKFFFNFINAKIFLELNQ